MFARWWCFSTHKNTHANVSRHSQVNHIEFIQVVCCFCALADTITKTQSAHFPTRYNSNMLPLLLLSCREAIRKRIWSSVSPLLNMKSDSTLCELVSTKCIICLLLLIHYYFQVMPPSVSTGCIRYIVS